MVAARRKRRTAAHTRSRPPQNDMEEPSSTATIVQAMESMTVALRTVAQSTAMATEQNRAFMDAAIQELRMVGRRVTEQENDWEAMDVGAATAPGS